MKLLDLRNELKNEFNQQGIDVADADFIISEVLGVNRTDLVLISNIEEDKVETIKSKVKERLNNKPVEKIFNRAYFYGLEFWVDENVLSPRPETEIVVDEALNYIKQNNYNSVLDLCTGSGCIAISIKKS